MSSTHTYTVTIEVDDEVKADHQMVADDIVYPLTDADGHYGITVRVVAHNTTGQFPVEVDTTALMARFAPDISRQVSVPEEWLPEIVALDARLAEIDPNYLLVQVKEKFGGLRISFRSYSPRSKAMRKMANEVERKFTP